MTLIRNAVRDYRAQPHRWLGQRWLRSIYHSPDTPPASYAQVGEFPGHRRDNVFL